MSTCVAITVDVALLGCGTVDSAVLLEGPRGRLFFQGPGAGPDATAATVVDDVADLLAAHGLYVHRATTTCAPDPREHRSLLLHEAPRPRVERAVAALQAAARCSVSILRPLEVTA